jgi:hypothetical protein
MPPYLESTTSASVTRVLSRQRDGMFVLAFMHHASLSWNLCHESIRTPQRGNGEYLKLDN